MASKATVTVAGDAKSLIDQIDKANRRMDKLEKNLRDVKNQGRKSSKEIDRGFGSVAGKIGQVAAGVTLANMASKAFHATLKLITAELDNIKTRRLEAAATAGDIGQARAIALGNLPAGMTVGQLDQMVETAATRPGLKIPRARGYQIAGNIMSASGGMSFQQMRGAFSEAARESARTGGAPAGAFGGAVADIMKQIPGTTNTQAAGLLEQFGKASRIVERPEQARAITKGIGLAGGAGISEERTLEMIAALTQFGDVSGQTSVQAISRLYKNLDIARTKGYDIGGGQRLRISGRGDEGMEELIRKVRGLRLEQQDRFFSKFQLGKGATGFAVRQILTGTAVGRERLRAAEAAIGPPSEAAASRERTLRASGSGIYGIQAEVIREMDVGTETLQLLDKKRIIAGTVLSRLQPKLIAAGASALSQKFADLSMTLDTGQPIESAISALQAAREPRMIDPLPVSIGVFGPRPESRPNPDYNPRANQELNKAINVLTNAIQRLEANKNDVPQKVQSEGPGAVNAHVEPD